LIFFVFDENIYQWVREIKGTVALNPRFAPSRFAKQEMLGVCNAKHFVRIWYKSFSVSWKLRWKWAFTILT
jgi:hypothetical protein